MRESIGEGGREAASQEEGREMYLKGGFSVSAFQKGWMLTMSSPMQTRRIPVDVPATRIGRRKAGDGMGSHNSYCAGAGDRVHGSGVMVARTG